MLHVPQNIDKKMDLEKLAELNAEFAKDAEQMSEEFLELFQKWKKKSTRLTVIMAIHMPLNIIMSMLFIDKDNHFPRLMEDFPDIFVRFLKPFVKIKDQWGKISSKEFVSAYKKEYESQFDPLFFDQEQKEIFKKWFKKQLTIRKKNG